MVERLTFTNQSSKPVTVEVERTEKTAHTAASMGVYGEYVIGSRVLDPGERTVKPGESTTFDLVVYGAQGVGARVGGRSAGGADGPGRA